MNAIMRRFSFVCKQELQQQASWRIVCSSLQELWQQA
jgi:hypothetical protein